MTTDDRTSPGPALEPEEFFRRLDVVVPGDAAPDGAFPPPATELYFERLSIAGLDEMDRFSRDPRLYEFLEYRPFASREETKAYIERLLQETGTEVTGRTAMGWFVRRNADRRLIGTARLVNINYARQSAEWGYGVDPELWGTGYILQLQEMLKHYCFVVLGLNRLSGISMVDNQRTIASLLATGMVHEGTARQAYRKDGQYRDGWLYGMLAADYFREPVIPARTLVSYTMADVITIVSSVLTESEIGPASTNLNTPHWDSLNHMAIMEAVAAATGLNLSPSQIMRANSVSTLLSIVNGVR